LHHELVRPEYILGDCFPECNWPVDTVENVRTRFIKCADDLRFSGEGIVDIGRVILPFYRVVRTNNTPEARIHSTFGLIFIIQTKAESPCNPLDNIA